MFGQQALAHASTIWVKGFIRIGTRVARSIQDEFHANHIGMSHYHPPHRQKV